MQRMIDFQKKKKNEEEVNDSLKSTKNELSDELLKLSELFKSGTLTEEEFEKQKREFQKINFFPLTINYLLLKNKFFHQQDEFEYL